MSACAFGAIFILSLASLIGTAFSSVSCNNCVAPHQCVGNSNVQAVEDEHCAACANGQTWWPCNIENLCFCWDPSTPRVPPPPSSGLDFAEAEPCEILTEADFNTLTGGMHQAPYTYAGLCAAIEEYNHLHPTEHVFKMGTLEQQKAEIAAFLGNTLHESDGFKAPREYLPCGDSKVVDGKTYCKPCESGSFDWASKQCSNSQVAAGGAFSDYCSSDRSPPDACSCGSVVEAGSSEELAGYMEADKAFFGRGAIQLSWNYNYIRASIALTGNPETFCANPDLVATVEKYAWGAGIYFWMENMKNVQGSQGELSTCHIQALSGEMGGTLWNINGGQECPASGDWHAQAVVMRINHYCRAATAIGVASLLSFDGCTGMKEAFSNCDSDHALSEGGCPDCGAWKHISTSSISTSSTAPDLDITSTMSAVGTSTTTAADLDTTSTASAVGTSTAVVIATSTSTTTDVPLDTTTSFVAAFTTVTTTRPESTTLTTTRAGTCVDADLTIAWSGGGAFTCQTYEHHGGLAYCDHVELQQACCFCGGGQPEPSPVSTSSASPTSSTSTNQGTSVSATTTATVSMTATVSQCTDAPLPLAWSAGGVYTCATYENHGGLAYCAHQELAEACCFCLEGRRLASASVQSVHVSAPLAGSSSLAGAARSREYIHV